VAEAAASGGIAAALIDGVPSQQLPLSDRALHYGDGLFETIACVHGAPRFLERHLHRLALGCRRLAITCPEAARLTQEVRALARTAERSVVKLIVTRGSARARGYRPGGEEPARRVLLRYPWPADDPAAARAGVRVRTAAMRLGENAALAGIKHLNRLEQVLAAAALGDAAEALLYSSSGALISGIMSNVFLVHGARLLTPQLDVCGVSGIMRELVLEAAAAAGIAVDIRRLEAPDLAGVREMFLTNALTGIRPVGRLDEQVFEIGALTRQLQARLEPQLAAGATPCP
jgi:4-amino-4-deoxychorismate lyase